MFYILLNLESPSPMDALCQICFKLTQWFESRKFLILSMYFRYFVIICPWKLAWPFIITNLNSLYPRMLCAKFSWNWSSGSEEKIFKYCQCIFDTSLLSPLSKGSGPAFDQTWIFFSQECFVPSLVDIGPVVLEKIKCEKFTTRQTDEKRSLELWAQLS